MKTIELQSYNELIAILTDSPLCIDLETHGLGGRISLATFYQRQWADTVYYITFPEPAALSLFLTFHTKKCGILGQGLSYDITTISKRLARIWHYPHNMEDTLILAQSCFNLEHNDLETLVNTFLKVQFVSDKHKCQQAFKKVKTPADLTDELIFYGCEDVYLTDKLFWELSDYHKTTDYRLNKAVLKPFAYMGKQGLPVMQDKAKAIADKCKAEAKSVKILDASGIEINPRSNPQTTKLLGTPKADKETLLPLALAGNKTARDILKARKALKLVTDAEKMAKDPFYRGTFKPSCRTGRSSCAEHNLQNVTGILRDCVETKTENEVLVYADFSQLELRCAALWYGEPTMIETFMQGGDVHNLTASKIYGDKFTIDDRQLAKASNFGLLYGQGAGGFTAKINQAREFPLTLDAGYTLRQDWLQAYPVFAQAIRQAYDTLYPNFTYTLTGRKVKVVSAVADLNYRIQSFGAFVAKTALCYLHQELAILTKLQIIPINFVHDSYLYRSPLINSYQAASILADCMQKAWRLMLTKYYKGQDLPMPVEVKVGRNWGDIENGKNIIAQYRRDWNETEIKLIRGK